MENFISFSWNLVYLILYISLIIYFFQNRKIYTFVKGVFLTSLFFRIIGWLFEILMYTFSIESIRKIFGWDGNLQFLMNFINITSYFLLLFGVSLLIGKEYIIGNEKKAYLTMEGSRRNIGFLLILFIITLGFYFPFWLYRTVKDLKNNFEDDIPYTPGKAVGFLFIPIFNIFWAFYILFSLPSRIKKIESKYYGENVGFYFHPLLIPILLIIFIIISNLQIRVKFETSTYGSILFFESAIFLLWLTIQAKLNSFYDFENESIEKKEFSSRLKNKEKKGKVLLSSIEDPEILVGQIAFDSDNGYYLGKLVNITKVDGKCLIKGDFDNDISRDLNKVLVKA